MRNTLKTVFLQSGGYGPNERDIIVIDDQNPDHEILFQSALDNDDTRAVILTDKTPLGPILKDLEALAARRHILHRGAKIIKYAAKTEEGFGRASVPLGERM